MRSLHHKKPSEMYERRRKMRKSCVYFSEMVRSIQLLMEKPGGVVRVVCSPASFFLSYTSTRIPAIRIIRMFPPPGTKESWDDISNLTRGESAC